MYKDISTLLSYEMLGLLVEMVNDVPPLVQGYDKVYESMRHLCHSILRI